MREKALLHDLRPDVGLRLGLASSLRKCHCHPHLQMRTLNLGELMFAHLVLWQIWDLNPGFSDTSLNNITEQGKRAGQGRGSWENWVLFLILALTHCVTLGTSPALSGPARYLSEDMLILEPFSPQGG